jgi:hypothetical protein
MHTNYEFLIPGVYESKTLTNPEMTTLSSKETAHHHSNIRLIKSGGIKKCILTISNIFLAIPL